MPLLKEWKVGDTGLAAIWRADEPEAFFVAQTGITSTIKSDVRRVEHLAGRYLLKHLHDDFPLADIYKDEHDKPRLKEKQWHFSISHSWPYIAAVIDPVHEAGIDIQVWHPRISAIKHKFLSPGEQELLLHDDHNFILAWSAKESAYKWNGRRGVEFIEELPIISWDANKNIKIFLNSHRGREIACVNSIITSDFACTYLDKSVALA